MPPKTLNLGEHTKGDTISGTSILRNAVRQFGKPKGARVGTSSGVIVTLSARRARDDGVARFPGGTVHIHGVGKIDSNPKVPIVGGTGRFDGATGYYEQIATFAVPLGTADVIPYLNVSFGTISFHH